MKIILVSVLAIFSFILLSFKNNRNPELVIRKEIWIDSITPLVVYGKYIFEREKCIRCHTLQLDSSKTLVSLDGIGENFSTFWQYNHLDDPSAISPGTQMPSYSHLELKKLFPSTLKKILEEQHNYPGDGETEMLFKQLSDSAEVIANSLNETFIQIQPDREIIALIAYLQQIPSSPAKQKADSIWAIQRKETDAKEELTLNKAILDLNSPLMLFAFSKNENTIMEGNQLFQLTCSVCHGRNGQGGVGPNLTDEYWLHGGDAASIIKTIFNGAPDHGMMAWKHAYGPEEIGQLTAYIRSLKGTNPPDAKAPQGTKE